MSGLEQASELPEAELYEAIWRIKRDLGRELVILGHHYQRDEVIQFADFRGDSLELSRRAASVADARYIVFCGVTFMAETAAMLCDANQRVIQPVLEATCPMADMATAQDAQVAWDTLTELYGPGLVPITYQNSTAEVKAFVGEHGGAVCTSSNARSVFDWALERGSHILFMPDEHLGTNTALDMGIAESEIGVWHPRNLLPPKAFAAARVVVWRGFCSVHTRMTRADVERARKENPAALIIVHPECRRSVVERADASGSTAGIIAFVEQAPAGSTIYIGTEINLVNRLQQEHRDKTVLPLCPSRCATMSMTTPRDLLHILEGLQAGQVRNTVSVGEETKRWARIALDRMLAV